MTTGDGFKWFGYFDGMEYCPEHNEPFDQYKTYQNSISKDAVIHHIESLDPAYAAFVSKNIFTGEIFPNAGMYVDGEYLFPIDFLFYYRNYDIGIPPEYEEYLIRVHGIT